MHTISFPLFLFAPFNFHPRVQPVQFVRNFYIDERVILSSGKSTHAFDEWNMMDEE